MTLAAISLAVLCLGQGWPPRNGSSLPGTCSTGQSYWLTTTTTTQLYECTSTDNWEHVTGNGAAPGGLPAGAIVLSLAACPTGFSEVTALNGKFVLGTLNASGDVTTTGGADTISAVLNHTHTVNVNDPGHGHTQNSHNHTQDPHSHGMAEGQTDGAGTLMDRSNAASATTTTTDAATATNQAATATNQTNTTGVTASTSNPAGGVASFDNRPAFVKVIFCAAD